MATEKSPVAVVTVPLPAQGHLNQMLQFSCLVSSYGLPVYYVGTAVHNRQAQVRINAGDPENVAKVQFHDIPTPPIHTLPPDPNSANKFPSHLDPGLTATLSLRQPVAAFLQSMAEKFTRVVVVHDPWMSAVVQDVDKIKNAESYEFVCISIFSRISFFCGFVGIPFPVPHPKELPPFEEWMSEAANAFSHLQYMASLNRRSGNIFNTSRLIEGPYVEVVEREELAKSRPCWAIGPILPTSSPNKTHACLEWLDKQAPKSVIYIAFGTTVTLSDEQINELAHGLEQSKVKFLWVLRDADKGDVFNEEVRRAELPEGFEERVGGDQGMVVRDWAPQPQILAHPSTGGFMSHCGWNSCLESTKMGVAMAAWPMHSDQPSNAALVADILKTGLVVREWKQRAQVVKASTVENVVTRLMASEEGGEIRMRAEELGVAMRRATDPGGASRLELDSFIAHITR